MSKQATTMKRWSDESLADRYMRRVNQQAIRANRCKDFTVIVADEDGREVVTMSTREAIANEFAYRWAS